MGQQLDNNALVVLNSLGQDVKTLVHFVCTRPDVAIVRYHDDGSKESILAQATPLEHELEVANLGLFLISFQASVPALGKSQFRLQVCVLTYTTDQHPLPTIPSLDCAHQAQEMAADEVTKSGLSSSSIQVDFDETTYDLASLERFYDDGSSVKTSLTHDLMLYYGGDDNIYTFETNVESSNPPPLLGKKKRRFICAYQGPLFSQVTLEYTPWLVARYRVVNTTTTTSTKNNNAGADESLLQVSMLSGPLPQSVNLASRFQTSWMDTNWYFEENGFHSIQASYNSSHGVGDRNSRPMVSRSWLEEESQGDDKVLTVFTVDPRAVVSKESGQMDVFWHRRNNKTKAWWDKKTNRDWWKEGEDVSISRSSVWLGLSQKQHVDDPSPRQISLQLSNDLVLLSTDGSDLLPKDTAFSNAMPSNLHIMTLRLSDVDDSLNHNNREESWLDLQVENLSETKDSVDVALLLGDATRITLNAILLYSLTYLSPLPTSQNDSDSCFLQAEDGGKRWILSIGARHICSVRVPVAPMQNLESTESPLF
jgi:hypothetical protein